jgi:hypothetical protein
MRFSRIHRPSTTKGSSVPASIPKKERRPLTPWELPSLLTPAHALRRSPKRCRKERPHFAAILGFTYRNRFAVASQIQRRLSDSLRSGRTARRHLEELESLEYLGVAPARGVGPLFPKVYYVTGRGVRRLGELLSQRGKPWSPGPVDRRGRDSREGYAAERIIHELLITEFMLAVWQTVEKRPDLELLTVQRRSLAKHPDFRVEVGGRAALVLPDALFLFRHESAGMVCCFLEMDNGTMNAKQIRAKFARYAAWSQSAPGRQYLVDLYGRHGAKDPRPVFRLLVVARSRTGLDDGARSSWFLAAAGRLPVAMRKRVWLTTVAALRERQHDDHPLGASVWVRPDDLPGPAGSAPAEGQAARGVHHCLFPPAALDESAS